MVGIEAHFPLKCPIVYFFLNLEATDLLHTINQVEPRGILALTPAHEETWLLRTTLSFLVSQEVF